MPNPSPSEVLFSNAHWRSRDLVYLTMVDLHSIDLRSLTEVEVSTLLDYVNGVLDAARAVSATDHSSYASLNQYRSRVIDRLEELEERESQDDKRLRRAENGHRE